MYRSTPRTAWSADVIRGAHFFRVRKGLMMLKPGSRTRTGAAAGIAALLAAAVSACSSTHAATYTQAVKHPASQLAIASSLDGRTVLPHHLHWLAYPKLPQADVAEVDFVIDGKTYWVEKQAPYVYSGDLNGRQEGYLVPSFLAPGLHRFAVRAQTTDGRAATDAVTARVVPPAAVPAALAGTWRRALAHPVPPDTGGEGSQPTPAGTYTITFSRQWIEDHFPGTFSPSNKICNGCILDDDYVPATHTFRVWGGVNVAAQSHWTARGGWWCNADGPAATYSWSVSGTTLTLKPSGGKDACGQRGATWTGQWTRIG